ncbi:hypothetical protein [uncultured Winogradskyella sp.]|uniref:hypothetical protein n=1 Tax=uncultured Winogradskyella sp. TaxID=395353 RepID=UPI00261F6C66|nr:hypothetical protein [uncultured Winogradskyella sp.]
MNKKFRFFYKSILVVLLVLTYNVEAQTDNKAIKTDFAVYLEAIKSKDFETSLDYLVEEVFDIIPRETMLVVMDQTFNTEGIEFTFGDFNIDTIQKPIKIDSTSYVILNYTSNMSIRFVSAEDEEADDEEEATEEDEKMMRMMTQAALEQQFGKENVSYNRSTNFFDITAVKKAVAVKKDGNKQWKFLVVEKGKPFLLKAILPNSILEEVLTED